MEDIVRTVYGSFLQTCQVLNLPFTMVENTTLNEKFSIQNGVAPGVGVMPALGYMAIGIGAHAFTMGTDSIPLIKTVPHKATDASLYKQIPFVLRELTDDLTITEQAKYALRRQETHDGVGYYAYYLKRIDVDGVTPVMQYKVVDSGETTITNFVPTSSNLNPDATEIAASGTLVTTGEYVGTEADISAAFTADEVTEILNAVKVIYGSEDYALMSEIALCSGVDKIVQVTSNGNTINFKEAIAVQVNTFVHVKHVMTSLTDGIANTLAVGSTEPLLNLTNI